METLTTHDLDTRNDILNAQLAAYTQQVLKTAQAEAFDLQYLIPGIVGEIGEMFGHKAKAFWHGKSEEALHLELKLELGDVCWMSALLLHRQGLTEIGAWADELSSDPWNELMDRAADLYYAYSSDRIRSIEPAVRRLYRFIAAHSVELTGHSFQDVLEANTQKLADRAARNVLRGSGDHR